VSSAVDDPVVGMSAEVDMVRMRSLVSSVLLAAYGLALVGCGGGGDSGSTPSGSVSVAPPSSSSSSSSSAASSVSSSSSSSAAPITGIATPEGVAVVTATNAG
jgi:hypothetical protein